MQCIYRHFIFVTGFNLQPLLRSVNLWKSIKPTGLTLFDPAYGHPIIINISRWTDLSTCEMDCLLHTQAKEILCLAVQCFSGCSLQILKSVSPWRPPQAFSVVFQKAVLKAEQDEALRQRVSNLTDSITFSVFQYTTRGLFECDKLTYTAQLMFQVGRGAAFIFCSPCFKNTPALRQQVLSESNQVERNAENPTMSSCPSCPQVLLMNNEINPAELDFLLRYPVQPGVTSPVDFLSNHSWGGVKVQRKKWHVVR